MFKKSLLVLGTAVAIATTAAPAFAFGNRDTSDPKPVPEPMTAIGSLIVGGGLIAKKLSSKKAAE